ncbi:MAG: AI-2E family transporter [Clostridia bacterium]|nr:AI-2E family transporter [Clostridia bacterium]
MEKKLTFKQIMIIVAFGIILFVGLMNIGTVFSALGYAVGIVSPLVYGGVAAAVLNVLMSAIEKGIRKLFKKRVLKDGLVTAVSLVLSLVIVFGAVAGVILLVVPQFASAVPMIVSSIKDNWGVISEFLSDINVDPTAVYNLLTNLDAGTVLQKLTSGIGDVFGTVISAASSITGGVFTFLISLVACIYILVGKKKLAKQMNGVLYAYVDKKWADKISSFCKTLNDTFKRFLSSQCIDACILGALLCVTMLVLRLPYAGVISALTVIFALIPYFGAFFSCALGAFFIVLIDLKSALIFIVVFLVVQQIEGNLIYPKIVGTSVGLPALWTLLAVYVGGKLFGVVGMILFIPVVSVAYTMLSDNVKKKLADKTKEKEDEAVL